VVVERNRSVLVLVRITIQIDELKEKKPWLRFEVTEFFWFLYPFSP